MESDAARVQVSAERGLNTLHCNTNAENNDFQEHQFLSTLQQDQGTWFEIFHAGRDSSIMGVVVVNFWPLVFRDMHSTLMNTLSLWRLPRPSSYERSKRLSLSTGVRCDSARGRSQNYDLSRTADLNL